MTQDPDKLNELSEKLELLLHKQDQLQVEVHRLKREIESWKRAQNPGAAPEPAAPKPLSERPVAVTTKTVPTAPPAREKPERPPLLSRLSVPTSGLDLEKFIGENLISKIGILILVIGVAFGAKYAIDHELISPLMRIIFGYLSGLALLGLAIRMKAKYENFSAVLLSGALAILYIITYFAYSYYQLFPQALAFALMVLFTAFTVLAALQYDRQIIALMGLVGAYGVPFLLSENTGQVSVLLIYMSIINTGILVIAFRKYWKALFYTAFWITWLIFSWWILDGFNKSQFALAISFATVFYLLFYGTFVAYKLIKKETYRRSDIMLLLANSFIYFGFGYALLADQPGGENFLGLFAVANALVHFMVGRLIYRDQLADRNLFYFLIGLVLVFLTMAIPIQLDGNWVTLLWAGEAALLYWLGRRQKLPAYEKMALPLMLLALISLIQDWSVNYVYYFYPEQLDRLQPVWNIQLLSTFLFAAIFGLMLWLQRQEKFASAIPEGNGWRAIISFVLPAIFIVALYAGIRAEIEYYWRLQGFLQSPPEDSNLRVGEFTFQRLSNIWVVYYSLLFLALLAWVNMIWIKNRLLGWITLGMSVFGILSFLVICLYELSELRIEYLLSRSEGIIAPSYNYLRYLGYGLLAALLYTLYRYQKQEFIALRVAWPFDLLLHLTALWTVSSELIHLMDLSGSEQSYKLGLSILWGVYSLMLIALGIARRKVYLRVGAIVLFAITLIKLFFYDIAHLNTIAKTVVLLSLGVLLLAISFLYNKFKHIIANETDP